VAVVERTRAAVLERIASVRDLAHVQLGAAPDHPAHRRAFAGAQSVGLGLEPFEEHAVADQRDLHRLGDAGDLVARLQRAQEVGIVQDGERWREAAEQVLDAEGIDAVLDADTRVVLRQHRRRHANVADAAVRRRCDVADQVEERTAADADDEVVPVDAQVDETLLQPREQRRIVLDVLSAGHDLGMGDELQALAVQAGIAGDVVRERGK